jgi:Lrp/AsnC family leucine-responsive transcriptional regulator
MIVRVSPHNRGLHVIPELAREVPEVTECYWITARIAATSCVYVRSIDDLEPILDRFTPAGADDRIDRASELVDPRPLPLIPDEST